ncbi:unnamed protein product [Oppiella nova]|uniref:Uncharacterized protein n=1 Tax=Oppiella nova TaxID=334625 RepID=A0A7R9L7Z4_9ACAR|nr:unnamed protein product [Oppiella nova]CAG2158292.1 unnamed protein product [Oppiella nova]
MLSNCVTSKSSSPSSPVSMMSPSSLHSSPQASSSYSQDRSPVSSPSRVNLQSIPLLKPSAIKEPSVHFPPSTIPSMCFPLHAIYAQNPYSGIVGTNLSTFFSPHAIARQMSFLGNSFQHNLSGKRIPAEDFSRFPPVFSPLNTAHRTANASAYPTAKQGCLFPFNATHTSGAHHLHNTQNNMFNALNNEFTTSSPPFKRKMLNISGDTDLSTNASNESLLQQQSSMGSNSWCRSPSHPLTCPLCSISLEGVDISRHFIEEVHKVETFRK